MKLPHYLRHAIEGLGPYPSLFLLAVPLAVEEPLKLVAVFVAGDGHWVAGTAVMILAYAVGLFFTERLFVIVKPKLLTLHWFAVAWAWFVAIRDRALRWLRSTWTLGRKAVYRAVYDAGR